MTALSEQAEPCCCGDRFIDGPIPEHPLHSVHVRRDRHADGHQTCTRARGVSKPVFV